MNLNKFHCFYEQKQDGVSSDITEYFVDIMVNDGHLLFILKALTQIEFITYFWRQITNLTTIYSSIKVRDIHHIVCVMAACCNAVANMA